LGRLAEAGVRRIEGPVEREAVLIEAADYQEGTIGKGIIA
jgi:hypothetical protein